MFETLSVFREHRRHLIEGLHKHRQLVFRDYFDRALEIPSCNSIGCLSKRLYRDRYSARHVQCEPTRRENEQQRNRRQKKNVDRFDSLYLSEHAVKIFVLLGDGFGALCKLGWKLPGYDQNLRIVCSIREAHRGNDKDRGGAVAFVRSEEHTSELQSR